MPSSDPLAESSDPNSHRTADDLLPLLYGELRNLAARRLAHERPGQTLQVTSLVHEVYLRLAGSQSPRNRRWTGETHFLAAASEAMRWIIVDNARRRLAIKRGGNLQRLASDDLDAIMAQSGPSPEDLLALDEALTRLARLDPVKAELVKLRYFVGLTLEDAAEALSISRSTATRHWDFAKSWLFAELKGDMPNL